MFVAASGERVDASTNGHEHSAIRAHAFPAGSRIARFQAEGYV